MSEDTAVVEPVEACVPQACPTGECSTPVEPVAEDTVSAEVPDDSPLGDRRPLSHLPENLASLDDLYKHLQESLNRKVGKRKFSAADSRELLIGVFEGLIKLTFLPDANGVVPRRQTRSLPAGLGSFELSVAKQMGKRKVVDGEKPRGESRKILWNPGTTVKQQLISLGDPPAEVAAPEVVAPAAATPSQEPTS